jgi:hypothetical protein
LREIDHERMGKEVAPIIKGHQVIALQNGQSRKSKIPETLATTSHQSRGCREIGPLSPS